MYKNLKKNHLGGWKIPGKKENHEKKINGGRWKRCYSN